MRSLYAKLALILTGLFVMVGLLLVFLVMQATGRYQQEVTQQLNESLAGNIVAERILFKSDGIDHAALEHIFHMLMVINPKLELYLLDASGLILAYSAPPGRVQRQSVSLQPIRQFLQGSYTAPLLGEDPRDAGARKVFSVAPIDIDGDRAGYLYVILAGEQYDSVTAMLQGSFVVQVSVLLVIVVMVFALAAGLILFWHLTRRLHALSREVEDFHQAGIAGKLPVNAGGDEIDRLLQSFHAMARRIGEQMQRLEQTDCLRRELVANVSHDLRTPLASLQGYLETLSIRADTLPADERMRYIDIAQRQCMHLTRLVGELFDLAKLDANEVKPTLEPFSLPELIQDVVQKFELRANERGIDLRSRLADALPFVVGDIALIERVLDNLLDNALRHTSSGGRVTVSLHSAGAGVAVLVTDTGEGIAEGDLPHIFDRFYKPDGSRGKAGTGLGLAIAKRIVELHGSVIRAVSDIGEGTVFGFELPTRT